MKYENGTDLMTNNNLLDGFLEVKTMINQKIKFFVVVFCICFLLIAPGTAITEVSDGTIKGGPVIYLDPATGASQFMHAQNNFESSIVKQKMIIDKENLTLNEKKLSTALLLETNRLSDLSVSNPVASGADLLTKTVPARALSTSDTSTPEKISSGKLVYVYFFLEPGYSTHIVDPFVADVTGRDENNHLAVGWVDMQNILEIAGLDGVRNIQEVISPRVNIGSKTTQGDSIHKTANIRSSYGYNGAGMKIGILSDGVDHISSSVATGELPSTVHVLSNTVGGDEGTAMLEIVHDMAPDAELYFHDVGSDWTAFNAAIDELIANGCTVICDDSYWPDTRFFENGVIASHVSAVVSGNKVVYISAAGNFAQKHYQGAFSSDAGTNWTDFSRGTDPTFKSLYLHMPAGSSVLVMLEWDDQFGQSGNDYDLYLYNTTSVLAYSENSQTGTQDPFEYLYYTNNGIDEDVEIDVYKYHGVSKELELYIMPASGADVYSDNIVASDSIFGASAVPDVISVAAVDQFTPSTIESFSSRGPVTISYPTTVSRPKPDISGVDGVNVSGAGGFSTQFYGTSASASHIAAIVAQIWGAHPTLTPVQVRNALYNSAVDLGTAGKDTTFGYGRADALAMSDLLGYPPAPVVNFTGAPLSGTTPLTVAFTDLSTNSPISWNWSFGDGSLVNTTKQNPVHTYVSAGIYTVSLNSTNAVGFNSTQKVGYIQVTNPPGRISIYNSGSWYIDMNGNGVWDAGDQNYGFGAPEWTPVTGDWNNDGKTEIGVYRDGAWYLDYDASGWWSEGDKNFGYGAPDWTPLAGDWNDNGYDEVGAYKDGAWYLDYNGNGIFDAGDKNFAFGAAGWAPVVGDWNDGKTKIGVYKDGIYYIDYSGDYAYGAGDKTIMYGTTGSTSIIGDWNANGLTEVGTKTGKVWQIDYDGLGAVNASTKSYSFGSAGWDPVIGDWNAGGNDKIGIYLNGAWYLDANGNGVWDAGIDKNFAFGTTGWIPVIGKWS